MLVAVLAISTFGARPDLAVGRVVAHQRSVLDAADIPHIAGKLLLLLR